jgi:hypothetical protein
MKLTLVIALCFSSCRMLQEVSSMAFRSPLTRPDGFMGFLSQHGIEMQGCTNALPGRGRKGTVEMKWEVVEVASRPFFVNKNPQLEHMAYAACIENILSQYVFPPEGPYGESFSIGFTSR